MPTGHVDINGQQVDLRKSNSWMLHLHEVSTGEMAEVLAINTIAPFVINARLRPLMRRDTTAMKFIINVSAMEGKFYRYKSARHPHTNMAKGGVEYDDADIRTGLRQGQNLHDCGRHWLDQ